MTEALTKKTRNTVPIMAGQGAFSVMAWNLASPSIVLTFIAVSMDLPIFSGRASGLGPSCGRDTGRHSSFRGRLARMTRKKRAIARTDVAVALCFLSMIALAVTGDRTTIIIAFVVTVFLIGALQEIKSLMIIDFMSDALQSADRMRVSYAQKALGGAATIALALLLHQLMQDAPALHRHATVVGFGAVCFVLSGLCILWMTESAVLDQPTPASDDNTANTFWEDVRSLLAEQWFRKYLLLRLAFVLTGLSVPFYALVAAEAHHSSARGLTALVVSSAAALMVAAPLWRMLNSYSNRVVMLAGAGMVALAGMGLIIIHHQGLDHTVHLHAVALFVVTVAVTGLGSARTLYFMEVAPKTQRIAAQAVSKTASRFAIVIFSMALAAVAHGGTTVWAVAAISAGSLLAVVAILTFVDAATLPRGNLIKGPAPGPPTHSPGAPQQRAGGNPRTTRRGLWTAPHDGWPFAAIRQPPLHLARTIATDTCRASSSFRTVRPR